MIINMNGAKAPETPSPVLQEKTVTPQTLPTVIGADEGYDGLSQVTVNPDSQLKAENIRSGKTIFGVEGTFAGEPQYTGDIYNVIENITPLSGSAAPVHKFGGEITTDIISGGPDEFYGRCTPKYAYSYNIEGNIIQLMFEPYNQGYKYQYAFKTNVPEYTFTYTHTLRGSSDYSRVEAHIAYYFNAGLALNASSYSANSQGNLLYPYSEAVHEMVTVVEGDVGTAKQVTITETVPAGELSLTQSSAKTPSKVVPFYVLGFMKIWYKPLE